MNIALKLKIMAVSSIAALVGVGLLGYYVGQKSGDALDYSNNKTLPSVQTMYKVKTAQQDIGLFLYRHLNSTQKEAQDLA